MEQQPRLGWALASATGGSGAAGPSLFGQWLLYQPQYSLGALPAVAGGCKAGGAGSLLCCPPGHAPGATGCEVVASPEGADLAVEAVARTVALLEPLLTLHMLNGAQCRINLSY